MLRQELELKMKEKKMEHIAIVFNEGELGVLCYLKSGILMDYTNHRVDRKKNIWGYVWWKDGKPFQVAFER